MNELAKKNDGEGNLGGGKMPPLVSLIMPVRNEAGFIRRSLGAVLQQDYDPRWMEIIVADGRSTDATPEIIRELIASHPQHTIRLMENKGEIFSTGFNLGLREARGQVIVMLGGHTEISPAYVRCCVNQLSEHPEFDCVGGYITTLGLTTMSKIIALAMGSPFGVGGVAFRTKPNRLLEVDTVAFGAYRLDAIRRCDFLDVELIRNQDDDYNYTLRDRGGHILLAPDIHAKYYSRNSLGSLACQYLQYGYWKVRIMQKHPFQMRPRHFVPPAYVGLLVCSALLGTASHAALLFFGGLIVLHVAASLIATVGVARKARRWYVIILPVVFPILHMSYGAGFLAGLARFWKRWGKSRRAQLTQTRL